MTDIIEQARGRWRGILLHYGIKNDYLRKRHGPCPVCGGKDRFIFDDKEGRGTFYCNSCGAGSGAQLLANFKGWSMSETMREVRKIVDGVDKTEPPKEMSDEKRRQLMNSLWTSAREPQAGSPAHSYIMTRCGTDIVPLAIRYHPAVYHSESKQELPAIIAKITAFDNKPVALHRIYLTPDGKKAPVEPNKKLMGTMPDGSAVRLGPYTDTLGIAEGIETALTCAVCFGIPTWAAVNATMLTKWRPPEIVEKVYIFGDNDRTFTGQLAAYKLAYRLAKEFPDKYKIKVVIPSAAGADWNDLHSLLGRNKLNEMFQSL